MDDELRQAIFSIRDSLAEMRDMMRFQMALHEKAMKESGNAKDALAKMMQAFPANIRSVVEPLTKSER